MYSSENNLWTLDLDFQLTDRGLTFNHNEHQKTFLHSLRRGHGLCYGKLSRLYVKPAT